MQRGSFKVVTSQHQNMKGNDSTVQELMYTYSLLDMIYSTYIVCIL